MLDEERADVVFHGVLADPRVERDGLVRGSCAFCERAKHFQLTRRERVLEVADDRFTRVAWLPVRRVRPISQTRGHG